MRGDDAKKVCPNIQLIQVPVARGKADLNLYRNAGSEVCWAQKKSLVTFLSVFYVFFFPLRMQRKTIHSILWLGLCWNFIQFAGSLHPFEEGAV